MNVSNELLLDLSKKNFKKWNKIKAKLERDGAEVLLTSTSCYLAIGNAGLHNGVCPKQLMGVIEEYGQVDIFQSVPGKAYVLVSFSCIDSCIHAFKKMQNYRILKCDGSNTYATLYAYYLKQFPVPSDVVNQSPYSTKLFFPLGLTIIEDFLSTSEEDSLVSLINCDFAQKSTNHSENNLKHRKVLHYGYSFKYGSNDVDLSDPLANTEPPSLIKQLIDKVIDTGLCSERPDQVTVNKYEPGQGISDHVDNPDAFGKHIISVSMCAQTIFEMRHRKGYHVNLLLKPRSLLIMSGESRYVWSHAIKPKKFDVITSDNEKTPSITPRLTRISITMRKVLKRDCNSSETSQTQTTLTNEDASLIESQHVRQVYNKIADHFACTREKPWPNVVKFLLNLNPYCKVLDVGCGSGRYLNIRDDIFMLGCDFSSSLVEICAKKHNFVFIGDGLNIPIKSCSFDACICIAVIHHYATRDRRESAIVELLRVLVNNGLLLIYVWAEEQRYQNKNSSYLKCSENDNLINNGQLKFNQSSSSTDNTSIDKGDSPTNEMPFPVHTNRRHFVTQDVFVPWKNKSVSKLNVSEEDTYYRYYHVFKENELVKICESLPNCKIVESYHDNGNWALVLQKC